MPNQTYWLIVNAYVQTHVLYWSLFPSKEAAELFIRDNTNLQPYQYVIKEIT